MGDIGVDLLGALGDQRVSGVHQGTAGINDIVDQDAGAPVDLADHIHDLGFAGPLAPLVDDGEGRVDAFGKTTGAHHAADIGGDHHDLVEVEPLLDVAHHDRGGIEIIGRNVEEALDLSG